jgi:hypothetical protein
VSRSPRNLDTHKVGVVGYSAGANLAMNLAANFDAGDPDAADPVERLSSRPDFVVGLATWHWRKKESPFHFVKDTPPVFLVHATNDGIGGGAPIELPRAIKTDLENLGVPVHMEDTPARRTNLPQVAAESAGAAGIALGTARDLLADAHRRENWVLGHQGVDLGPVRVQEAGAARDLARGGLVQAERRSHRVPRAMESARNRPSGEHLDLGQAANLGPQGDVHGELLSWWEGDAREAIGDEVMPRCEARR